MLCSIEVYFDQHTERLIKKHSLPIQTSAMAPVPLEWPARPHITLAIYDNMDLVQSDRLLCKAAASLSSFPVTLYSLDRFCDSTDIFLSPCTNKKLHHLQQSITQLFIDYDLFDSNTYQPDHWLPHCTLSYPDTNHAPDTFHLFSEESSSHRKITAMCEEIGISEVIFPAREIKSYPLASLRF